MKIFHTAIFKRLGICLKKAKKRGMMAIPLEVDRYLKMSFTFIPVMRSVKGESLDEP
jgi:hypothetical protein